VWHLYVIRTEKRDQLRDYLGEHNISSGIHYPIPIHMQGAYKEEMEHLAGAYPVTEAQAPTLLSLPMFPELTTEQQDYVVDRLKAFEAEHGL
ncbi:MAG: DegT/DnrJ/EryC1/StrS family aminotransferase, partial [Chloroflexota bacterium]